MAAKKNEYHIVWFDPGGRTGWAHLTVHRRAFIKPENKVLANLLEWETGEFDGTEHVQIRAATELIQKAHYGEMPFVTTCDVGSEDFELTQLIGGKELLIPVRMNAILDWECQRLHGLHLLLQRRNERTNVTKDRLKSWGMGWTGKDSFAAMQHAVTWLRKVKQKANRLPWKLDG